MKSDTKNLIIEAAKDIAVAMVFLTRVPIKLRFTFKMSHLKTASAGFPLVGVLTGLLGGFLYSVSYNLGLGPTVAAVIAISAQVLMTGALHEDAIADVADGFGGGGDKERKLEIMRDSRIGTYGVLALILVVGAKIFAVSRLEDPTLVAMALIAVGACSRAAMTGAMYFLPSAREDGLGKDAGEPTVKAFYIAILLALLISTLMFGSQAGVVIFAASAIGAAIIGWIAYRQIDGKTGDVLGCVQQIAEIASLITLVSLIY